MNTSSRKVLRKVLLGILIMEPNMRRSRIRRGGCPGTKRVPGWNRFSFKCHDATNRKKERGRKREIIRKVPTQSIYQNIKNGRYVCMQMHKHVICNSKDIMGSAQYNPTSTQSFQQCKHTSKMHEAVL